MAETAPLVSAEPQEREDPRNALLDMIEAVVETHDLAGPLFARLERMKPPHEPVVAPSTPAPAKAVEYSIERELRASKAKVGVDVLERVVRAASHKDLLKPIREIVDEEVAALRAARTWEQGE